MAAKLAILAAISGEMLRHTVPACEIECAEICSAKMPERQSECQLQVDIYGGQAQRYSFASALRTMSWEQTLGQYCLALCSCCLRMIAKFENLAGTYLVSAFFAIISSCLKSCWPIRPRLLEANARLFEKQKLFALTLAYQTSPTLLA
jgi:hypothetical protein